MKSVHDKFSEPVAISTIPVNNFGNFVMMVFHNQQTGSEQVALIKDPITPNQIPLVRIHSECITGDVFGSQRCDCGSQLNTSLSMIGEQGGVLIYLRQEGRGIGLVNKLKAYALQEAGYDTVEANLHLGLPVDSRDYIEACHILDYLGIDVIRLLTNNPRKIEALEQHGITISERMAIESEPNLHNRDYLATKQKKLGHFLKNLG